jgi:hypothetical protein
MTPSQAIAQWKRHIVDPGGTPPDPLHAVACPCCPWRGATVNTRSTHQLDAHERPLPPERREAWTVTPRPTRFVPPNWRAASVTEWYGPQTRTGRGDAP